MDAFGFGPRITVHRRGRIGSAFAAPPAVFDFTGGTLPMGATLARASTATRTDASGALVGAGSNVARFDYAGGVLRGLLIEPAATNAVSYSSDWTNGYWTRYSLGGASGTLMEPSSGTAAHLVRQTSGGVDYTAGQTVTASAIASERGASAKRYLVISLGATPVFAGYALAIFDLATGSVTATTNTEATGMVAQGGGAWLCWLSVTPVASSTSPLMTVFKLNSSATATNNYAGDGVSGLNVGNVQVETGMVASSRIVTGAGAGTRAADVLTLDWRSVGVADGAVAVRYTFDDLSTQDVTATVAGGIAIVPTTLARRRIRRAQKL